MSSIRYLPPIDEQFSDQVGRLFSDEMEGKKIKNLTFKVTEDCNLKCSYCYQLNKSHKALNFEIAKKLIDGIFDNKYPDICIDNTKGFILEFIGGEPLMEINLISDICDYFFNVALEKYYECLLYTRISICSNGILFFDEDVQKFFKKYNDFTSFAVTIDGNKEIHDACRVDFSGNGSYDRVIKTVHAYRDLYGKLPGTKVTFAPSNIFYVCDALISLINEGYTKIPCNCVYEEGWTVEHATILYSELKKLANYLIDNELYDKITIRLFKEHEYRPLDPSDNRNFCGGTNSDTMFAVDFEGDLYHCIRFMESSLDGDQPKFHIGTVDNGIGITEEEHEHIKKCSEVTRRSQSTDECFYCPVAAGCAWCSAYCYQIFGTVNKRTTFNCLMHKAAALANVYYWNTLYKKLRIDKTFENRLKEDNDALNIVGKDELEFLNTLERGV